MSVTFEQRFLDPKIYAGSEKGVQFQWLNERLALHGIPQLYWGQKLQDRVKLFQLSKGWTGAGADGLVGPKTLLLLSMPPGNVNRIGRRNWKITNPDGSEVLQPEFELYQDKPWFWEDEDGTQIFRAPTSGGGTTPNTSYFRSECREMENDGRSRAAWSSDEPRIFKGRLAFTALPHVKEHAVGFQIHDDKDDVLMGRLEGRKLFIESPYFEDLILTSDYRLGTFFNIEIVPNSAGIKVIYNDTKTVALHGVAGDDWYYKYGCYAQARAGQVYNGQTVPKDSFAEVRYKAAEVRE